MKAAYVIINYVINSRDLPACLRYVRYRRTETDNKQVNNSVARIRVVRIITEVVSIDFSPEPSGILQRKEKGDQGKAGNVWGEQHHSDTVGERVQISLVQRLHQKAS